MTSGYRLLDSGNGERLEAWGETVLRRPDVVAAWPRRLTDADWSNADAVFVETKAKGAWQTKTATPAQWTARHGGLEFGLALGATKQVGLFPEQEQNWTWLAEVVTRAALPLNVLNLFAYTGGATLALAKAGAAVCHVDSSRTAVRQARENATLNALADAPIRWIVDDAHAFVQREIRRGRRYDAVVLDPPAFGRGAKGEIWTLSRDLPALLQKISELLSEKPNFILLNAYAETWTNEDYKQAIVRAFPGGKLECIQLHIGEAGAGGRKLPAGASYRWQSRT